MSIQVLEDSEEMPNQVITKNLGKGDDERIKERTESEIKKIKEVKNDEKNDWLHKAQEEVTALLKQYNEIKKKVKHPTISSEDLMPLDPLLQSLEDQENILNKGR